ncbi:MAG: response regulator [Calditrichaeota bacterium]|nr:response regulator [Calditrichota bacterium]
MKKILVVDDEHDIRVMLDEFLTLKNFKVKTAQDGLDALNVIDDFKPDLAIVDIKMPNMDGVDFSKTILKKNSSFSIIVITGYAAQYNIDEILEIGVKKILSKPLNFSTLYDTIQKYIH